MVKNAFDPSQTAAETGSGLIMIVEVDTVKPVALVAVLQPTVTVMPPVVAPAGTVVVMLVVVLAVTVAAMPLKVTVLFAGVVLKSVPVMVTVVPIVPVVGVKLEIPGEGIEVTVLRRTEIVLLVPLEAANSGVPSPSRSPLITL